MKILKTVSLAGLAVLVALASGPTIGEAKDVKVQSLRGAATLEAEPDAADLKTVETGNKFERNYRQQPPLIPHEIDSYQIDVKANQCIACHDWPQNVGADAPKISETHYVGRDGNRLNHVSSARWFCTQCHVPQDEVEALIPNTFESSFDLE